MNEDEVQAPGWLVPRVPLVPRRERVDLGPAGSVRAARDRERITRRLERGPLVRDLERAPVVGVALVGVVLAVAAGVIAPQARALVLAVLALALLAGAVRAIWSWRGGGPGLDEMRRTIAQEVALAGELAPLRAHGWTVLADRLVPGGEARVPFVLVGPAGVVLLTPTPGEGPWWTHDDGAAFLDGRPLTTWARTRQWEARQVLDAMFLAAQGYEFTGPVYVIAAVPGPRRRGLGKRARAARLVPAHPGSVEQVPLVPYRHVRAAVTDLPAPLPAETVAGLALIAADMCPPAGVKNGLEARSKRFVIRPHALLSRLRSNRIEATE